MIDLDVILPGGPPVDGSLQRRARFRPLTGRTEQSVVDAGRAVDRPGYVTTMLALALERIGDTPVNAAILARLCVADRQFLMLRLAAVIAGEQMWLKNGCARCDALFDVEVRRCDLPVKPAGPQFPCTTLRLGQRSVDLRVPTGADQEHIQQLSDADAFRELLKRSIRSVDGQPPDEEILDSLSAADIEAIDQSLDEASPAVCNQLLVTCPECGREQSAELDHYDLTGLNRHDFYDQVHTLASHYHWSEDAILDLPQARRHLYLGLINRSVGMTAQEPPL